MNLYAKDMAQPNAISENGKWACGAHFASGDMNQAFYVWGSIWNTETGERIYLEEGPEGFAIERRGRSSTGRPRKLSKEVEEDLLAEVQRLRAENEYLKNLQALVLEDERRQRKGRR